MLVLSDLDCFQRFVLNEFHIEIYFELCGVGADIALYEKSLKSILGFRYRNNGVVFGDEKWKLLNQSKLFLLPSYYEGFPMALLEAMSAGCVPIVTSVGSISEIIRHNINGLIVNKCAPKEIADSILCIINNHKLAEMISNNATKTILENYNIDKYKKKLFDIYQNLFH